MLALAPTAKGADDDFSLSITPYAWFAGATGTVGVLGFKVEEDVTFWDVYDESDTLVGFFGRAEGRFRRFGFYVDGGYAQIGVDGVSGPLGLASIDVTQHITVIDFGLMYRLIDRRDEDSRFALDATVGARYWNMEIEFDPALLPLTLSGDQNWIDPTVGLRSTIGIGRKWEIVLAGDIGGFDVDSQFTWSAIGTIGYVFNMGRVESSIFAGYKAIGDDFTDGGFTWDATLHGPIIGWRFTF
ncbi:MAG: hypothetical protein WBD40_23990 [Tepidisphaeraceae bacterium]